MSNAAFSGLDLLSTSHEDVLKSADFALVEPTTRCIKHAPYICFVDNTNRANLVQGCCNSWTCPRCGIMRAKVEYGRVVQGAKMLKERGAKLYMHTWTCRGKELEISDAEANYGKWTNLMLNACRDRAKSQKHDWTYAQVTERQKRAHPHSHILTSFLPSDAVIKTVKKWDKSGKYIDRQVYTSVWYENRLKSAGLGNQYDITEVRDLVGAAVYCAKYFFKDTMFIEWPKHWKRVRYAQSWPKHPDRKPPEIAFAIIRRSDWDKIDALNRKVFCDTFDTFDVARRYGQLSVTVKQSEKVN